MQRVVPTKIKGVANHKSFVLALAALMMALLVTVSMPFHAHAYTPVNDGSTHTDNGIVTRYGVESLNLQDIYYYGFAKSSAVNYGSNYFKYGAGLELTWTLPPEVKAGDYFTLTLPQEINVDAAPDASKVFFTINDQNDPSKPVLKVYFTERKGERDVLKFVATDYAASKADGQHAYKGNAVIGSEIDPNTIKSIYRLKTALSGQDVLKPETTIDKRQKYYQGFRPNFEYFNKYPYQSANDNQVATLTYDTQYMDGPTFQLEDATSVSYRSQLYYDGYYYTRFGDLMIQPLHEDIDSITYMILYNVAGTGQAAGAVTPDFRINNIGFPQYGGHQLNQPTLVPYNGNNYASSMRLFKADPAQGTPVPQKMVEVSASQLNEETTVANATLKRYSSKFRFPDTKNTYVIYLKMRKLPQNVVDTPSGSKGYFISLYSDRRIRQYLVEDFYHGTTGAGNAVLTENPNTEIVTVPLTIQKLGEGNQPLTDQKTTFKLTDKATQYAVEKTTDAQGNVTFNGLFLDHQYTLEEIAVSDG